MCHWFELKGIIKYWHRWAPFCRRIINPYQLMIMKILSVQYFGWIFIFASLSDSILSGSVTNEIMLTFDVYPNDLYSVNRMSWNSTSKRLRQSVIWLSFGRLTFVPLAAGCWFFNVPPIAHGYTARRLKCMAVIMKWIIERPARELRCFWFFTEMAFWVTFLNVHAIAHCIDAHIVKPIKIVRLICCKHLDCKHFLLVNCKLFRLLPISPPQTV